jgi:hypothetical protein
MGRLDAPGQCTLFYQVVPEAGALDLEVRHRGFQTDGILQHQERLRWQVVQQHARLFVEVRQIELQGIERMPVAEGLQV